MSGQGAGAAGLAIASYEWMAAITLVVVALFFLPKFLKAGIYTIPEYLEYRYSPAARGIMAVYLLVIYVAVSIAAVVYTGALALNTIFGRRSRPRRLAHRDHRRRLHDLGRTEGGRLGRPLPGLGPHPGRDRDPDRRPQGRRRVERLRPGQRDQAPRDHAGQPSRHPLDDSASSACGSRISTTGA